ncbi:MAG TPA: PAS domain-containing protein [Candidatus Omnitrophota bacterium]|nr:PAS domain-containing protein [Candidatus Omnitrophota bacterium]HRZ14418.1 PAS domain-containing protein [Candidatus Omnitrophota bacterium]
MVKKKIAKSTLTSAAPVRHLLHLLAENTDSIILLQDPAGTYVYFNGAGTFGLEPGDLIGKKAEDCFPPAVAKKFNNQFRRCLKTGKPVSLELSVFLKKKHIWLIDRKYPIRNKKGRIIAVGTLARDISDHKTAELSLKASEEKFKTVFYTSPSLAAITEVETGRYIDVNAAFERVMGYTKAQAVGKTSFELGIWISPADRERVIDHFLTQGRKECVEVDLRARSGEIKRMLFAVDVVTFSDGKKYLFTSAVDITRRTLIENVLRDSEYKFRELFANMGSCAAIYAAVDNGRDFVFKDLNKAAEKTEEIARGDCIDRKVTEVFPGVKQFGLLEVLQRVWQTGTPEHLPVTLYQDERVSGWKENYVYKLPSDELVVVYDDVTQRKKAEDALKASLKEKEILLREINHRVKNNLQIINSLFNLQASRVSDRRLKSVLMENFARVRSIALVHEKLYQAANLERIVMRGYFIDLVATISGSFGIDPRVIAIAVDVDDTIEFGIDKAINCGLIVNELVTNAIKYAFPDQRKGSITITLYKDSREHYVLSVSDNGVGLPADFKLEQAKTLGLELVATLATNLGIAHMEGGEGTRYSIVMKSE